MGAVSPAPNLTLFFNPLYQMVGQIIKAGGKSSVMLPFILLILFQPLCSLQSSRWLGVQEPCSRGLCTTYFL